MFLFLVFFILKISFSSVTLQNPIEDQKVEPGQPFNFTIPIRSFYSSDNERVSYDLNGSEPTWTEVYTSSEYVAGQSDKYVHNVTNIFTYEGVSYVTYGVGGFIVINSTEDDLRVVLSRVEDFGNAIDVYVSGQHAHILTSTEQTLFIYDVSDPANPVYKSQVSFSGIAKSIFVLENIYAYILVDLSSSNSSLIIFDVSNKNAPSQVGTLDLPASSGMDCQGEYCYVCCETFGLKILNVSQRTEPSLVGEYASGRNCRGVVVDDTYAYLADGDSIMVLDIRNASMKENPFHVSSAQFESTCFVSDIIVDSASEYAFVSLSGDSFCGLGVADLRSLPTISAEVIDIVYPLRSHYDRPAKAITFQSDNHDVVNVVDRVWGFLQYDVSDRESITMITRYDFPHAMAQRVKVNDSIAFVSMDRAGLYIYDLSDLTSPSLLISIIFYEEVKNFDISLTEKIIYVVERDNAVHIIDVSDISNPRRIKRYEPPSKCTEVLLDQIEHMYLECDDDVGGGYIFVVNILDPANPYVDSFHYYESVSFSTSLYIDFSDPNFVYSTFYKLGFPGTCLLRILNVTDKTNTNQLVNTDDSTVFSGLCESFVVIGGVWLISVTGEEDELRVAEITNNKKEVHSREPINYLPAGSVGQNVFLQNDYLYVASESGGINILNVADPRPDEITPVDQIQILNGDAYGVFFSEGEGNLLYVAQDIYGLGMIGFGGVRLSGVSPGDEGDEDFYEETLVQVIATNENDENDKAEDFFRIIVQVSYFECFGVPNNVTDVGALCSDHGECWKKDMCRCYENYYGMYCNLTTCFGFFSNDSSFYCSSRGDCVDFDTCQCEDDYYGLECNITICGEGNFNNDTGKVCSGHGSCTEYIGDCLCDENYYGNVCNVTTCYSIWNNDTSSTQICSDHGVCKFHDNCECELPDYIGQTCNITSCHGISSTDHSEVCNGEEFGVCLDYDVCQCYENYYGLVCNVTMCNGIFNNISELNPNYCSNRGICSYYETCECINGMSFGDECQFDNAKCGDYYSNQTVLVCNGHGECVFDDDEGVCNCDHGYTENPEFICSEDESDDDGDDNDDDNSEDNSFLNSTYFPISVFGAVFVFLCLPLFFIFCLVCCCCCLFILFVFGGGGVSFILSFIGLFGGRKIYREFITDPEDDYDDVGPTTTTRSMSSKKKKKKRKKKKLDKFDKVSADKEMKRLFAEIDIDTSLFEIKYDDLEVVQEIGIGGGNAPIYHCMWKDQDVAFKCFQTQGLFGSKFMFQEFERESKVMSSLRHPNILDYYGSTLRPPRVGIVMEYCINGDLRHFLTNHEEFPLCERFRVLREASNGFAYLHDRNVLHRDVKSDNILLTEDFRAKIIDFGLSRIVTHMSTKKSVKIGTSWYMAPEIVLGENYNEKCDMFSFSIVMWEVLSNDFEPYKDEDLFNIEFRVAKKKKKRPNCKLLPKTVRKGETCKGFVSVLKSCWDHDPEERPSFEELGKILRKIEKKLSEEDGEEQLGELEEEEEGEKENEEKRRKKKRDDSDVEEEDFDTNSEEIIDETEGSSDEKGEEEDDEIGDGEEEEGESSSEEEEGEYYDDDDDGYFSDEEEEGRSQTVESEGVEYKESGSGSSGYEDEEVSEEFDSDEY